MSIANTPLRLNTIATGNNRETASALRELLGEAQTVQHAVNASTIKTYQFEVGTFRKGSIAPTEVTAGTAPVIRGLRLDATNQTIAFTMMTPLDAKPNCDFQMMFQVFIPASKTFTAGDIINLKVDYRTNGVGAAGTKVNDTGASVTTATSSSTAPFVIDGNDNVILADKNTEFFTYMPHVFLPAAALAPGGVFWGEVSLNAISGGSVDSIVVYQMHVNYFERSLLETVG